MQDKIKNIVLFSLLLSLTSSFVASSAFPQGREFARTRVISVPSSSTRYMGGGEAEDYKVMAGDALEITVWQEPELTRDVRVRPDGKFSYPLLRQVQAAGLTVSEIENSMIEGLLAYVKFPDVTVSVKETAGNTVIVLGEVLYPGVYTYKGQGDVLTAIGLAGDFLGTAKRESVIVITDNFTDHPVARRVNVFRSFYRGTKGDQFMLKPNDVVYVPKTFIADWNKTIADIQPTIQTLFNTNFMQTRSDVRTIYYNRDAPIKQQQVQGG